MRSAIVLIVGIALMCGMASGQNYGLGNADPAVFSKFKIPETDLRAFWSTAGFSTDYYKTNDTMSFYNYNNFSTNLSGNLSPHYYLLKENDDRYLSLSANIYGNYQNNFSQSSGTPYAPLVDKTQNKISDVNLNAAFTYRNYPDEGDMYYSIGSNVQADLSDSYQYTSNTSASNQYFGTKSQTYSLSLGIGWGKLRNVTSIVSAIRFQERLKQLNLANSDLSEKTIEDLAQEFYRQFYYSQVHVRPDKFFWQDIEKALSNDGVSLNGINEYADSYLREVPGELRFARTEGLIGGINLQMKYVNSYGSGWSPKIQEQLSPMISVYTDFSHQLSLNSQISINLSIDGGPNLMKYSTVKQQYDGSLNIDYNYELTDRLVFSAVNTLSDDIQNSYQQGTNFTNNLRITFNYFVEDQLSLSGSYYWHYQRMNDYNTYIKYGESDNSLQIGLTYYIDRGFMYP